MLSPFNNTQWALANDNSPLPILQLAILLSSRRKTLNKRSKFGYSGNSGRASICEVARTMNIKNMPK